MQPDSVAPRDVGYGRDGIDRRCRGRADGGDDGCRAGRRPRDPRRPSRRARRRAWRIRRRTERAANCRGRSRREARPCRPSYARAPTHRHARLALFALQAAARQRVIRRPLARANERDQRAGRGGVLDHAAPGRGEPEHLPQPIGDDFLDFRHRRARLPREPDHAEAGADKIAEDSGRQGVGGEIAEEARMLPERQARNDKAIEILDHRAEIFRLRRRRGGQRVADFAGLGLRHHRAFAQAFMIIGQPIDELMAIAAEFVRRHGRPCRLA